MGTLRASRRHWSRIMEPALDVARSPDRRRDDASNILLLEHVNLQIADPQLATLFYVSGLQLTRDPYLMVGLDNMWINAGRMQFHLPTRASATQRLRGRIGLIVPDLDVLENALDAVAPQLGQTQFSFRRKGRFVEATCPWGNCFRCHAPDDARWGSVQLGLMYIDLVVPAGCARAVANFYTEIFGAPGTIDVNDEGLQTATVRIGADQRLNFVETLAAIPVYDGHHIQIYVADFSGPHRRLEARNLVSKDADAHEWRFIDIVDLNSNTVVYQLEHEVRSTRHPLFGRAFVNRNPGQTNRAYVRGQDAFRGTY
jgi:hypothetical protein